MSTLHKRQSLEEIARALRPLREGGKRVALANGVFDLLHVGHVRYLEGARALADVLVVAVNSDASTRANKGEGRPIIPEGERAELVAALACTDFVLVFDEPDVRRIIRTLKPDVHVKGTDYTPESIPERAEVEAYGGRTAVAGDPKNHSTTALAGKLVSPAGVPSSRVPSQEGTLPIAPELLAILACPQCKGPLALSPAGDALHCHACKLAYRTEEDVPVLLVEEARPLS